MSFLLDASAVSLLRQDIPPKAQEWFSSKDDELFFVSVVAIVHGFAIVTHNTKDFHPTNATVINPWA